MNKPVCQQHMHTEAHDRGSDTCGKPAKWISPNGRYLCGVHKRVVDTFHQKTNSDQRCKPLRNPE